MAAAVETDDDALVHLGCSSSLPVPSVQQLAKENPTLLPTRYIRDDIESPAAASCSASSDVPVIDMQKLLGEDSGDSELQKLHFACKDWGFFQVIKPPNILQTNTFRITSETNRHYSRVCTGNTIEAYSLEVHKLAMKILSLVAKILGIKDEEMSMLFEEGMQSIRMNYYPPCPQPELVLGFSPHSDAGGLTILLQANETQGLEIKKDGIWVPIVPIPNAFIVNIGGSLEIFTNGIYNSIEHRGVVNREKERISIATFHSPKLNGELGPASNLITPQTPAKFKRVSVMDYFREFLGRKLDGKSHVDAYKIG